MSHEIEERVLAIIEAASALVKVGRKQEAYELLSRVEEEIAQVEDQDLRELWEACYGTLRFELGGDLRQRGRTFEFDLFHRLSESARKALDDDEPLVVQGAGSFLEMLRQELEETPEDEVALRHKLKVDLASCLLADGRPDEAEEYLQEIVALEGDSLDEALRLKSKILLARLLQHHRHDFRGACELFAGLLPDAERLLNDEERLGALGYALEAFGAGAADPARILELAGKAIELFEELLGRKPGSPARRRLRDVHQRMFEGALIALLSAAERIGQKTGMGQQLVARAWDVVMASRNPELCTARVRPVGLELLRLRELEDPFHRALRDEVIFGKKTSPKPWQTLLDDVFEHELTLLQAQSVPPQSTSDPSPEGVMLAFFQVRDLLRSHSLIILGSRVGTWTAHLIADAVDAVLGPLRDWNASLAAWAGPVRDARPRLGLPGTDEEASWGIELSRLLPPSLVPFASETGRSAPWFLFPDGPLNALPLEMLPEGPENKLRFGQGRPVHLCLRSSAGSTHRGRIDFSRGWLGLGGVPAAGRATSLPGSLEEVERLQALLRKHRYPAEIVTHEKATGTALRELLEACKPAVLHVAAHGSASSEFPDACALILADDPGRPERELLPFRRIRDLDLRGVDLVVLSACRSLIGRTGRGAGMEGLAWAFLQAGAGSVIASRVPVGDEDTSRLMAVLYGHLLELPVAEALGRTRHECLAALGISTREVGAWSVWI